MQPIPSWPPGAVRAPQEGSGKVIDSGGWLSKPEARTAEDLATIGHIVEAVPEADRATPDVIVDGVPVEIKHPTCKPGGRPPDSRTIINEVRNARKQAPHLLIDGRGTGLAETDADRGIRRAVGAYRWLRSIRILGDGFDLQWQRGS